MRRALGWAVIAALAATAPAAAETAVWAGYVRRGPSYTSPVVDELRRGAVVRSLGCEAGWCGIAIGRGRAGYVEAGVLARDAVPLRPAAGDCFIVYRPVFRADLPMRICPAVPR